MVGGYPFREHSLQEGSRHGHQAESLLALWPDEDTGLHRDFCKGVAFPNAEVRCVTEYPGLDESQEGRDIIEQFELLKSLKGTIH